MDTWIEAFADRVITPEAAAALVADGDLVVGGLPEPTLFLEALGARRDLEAIDVFVPAPRVGGVAVASNPAIRLLTPFRTQLLRKAGSPAEVLPVRLHDWAGLIERMGPRVAVVQVSTPDADGTVHAGSTVAANDRLIRRDRAPGDVVLGLVNPIVPHINGETYHVDEFDALIPVPVNDKAMPIFDERREPEHLDAFVGALEELIPDGATLQAGIGGIAERALYRLNGKADLGIHTEVLGAGLTHLVQTGVATGRRKTVFPDEAIFTISLPESFAAIDRNPQFRIEPARLVLDPALVASNHLMRCINSALEVDLWGQVNAEMIDGEQYSGVGGQLDFLRGCSLSNDALAIHVLPSTAAGGTRSRIVTKIGQNAVTGTRYDTQVIVTEYGIAWLRDATMRQKAERLISIAHPDFRAALTAEAEQAGML
ncbi:MAG: acetyl-CoA hydrolase/transferase family protein [Acidimicrobiales bacterium]